MKEKQEKSNKVVLALKKIFFSKFFTEGRITTDPEHVWDWVETQILLARIEGRKNYKKSLEIANINLKSVTDKVDEYMF